MGVHPCVDAVIELVLWSVPDPGPAPPACLPPGCLSLICSSLSHDTKSIGLGCALPSADGPWADELVLTLLLGRAGASESIQQAGH